MVLRDSSVGMSGMTVGRRARRPNRGWHAILECKRRANELTPVHGEFVNLRGDRHLEQTAAMVPLRVVCTRSGQGQHDRAASTGRAARLSLLYGCSLHHLGHLTLWGVRVAFTMIRCSAGLSVRPRRANAASTSHGSRAIRAVSR